MKRLSWIPVSRRQSRLFLGEKEVASLEFSGGHSSLAVAKSAKGNWTLKRSGFLRPKITARRAGSVSNYAVVAMNWSGGGRLQIEGGQRFRISRSGFLRPQLVVRDSSEKVLVSLKVHPRTGDAMVLVKGVSDLSEQDCLFAILAWYSIILTMKYENDAGTMAAIVAVVG